MSQRLASKYYHIRTSTYEFWGDINISCRAMRIHMEHKQPQTLGSSTYFSPNLLCTQSFYLRPPSKTKKMLTFTSYSRQNGQSIVRLCLLFLIWKEFHSPLSFRVIPGGFIMLHIYLQPILEFWKNHL